MRTTFGFLAFITAAGLALPAAAQQNFDEQGVHSGAPKAPRPTTHSEPPPAAVPGAKARAEAAAPADRAAADLAPTEALFDAINRGDIVTARDAISRGADLDGTNLLGLTPLELSVDLARNDISFLLLSLRGSGQRSGPPPTEEAAAKPTAADRRKAQADARAASRTQAAATRQQAASATASASAPQRAPALFAGNGGSAVPSAGFLGFDPRK